MALTLSGDDGVAGVNGSATTPAIQGTDTNTGLTFGTDTVNVVTGGTTRATMDASGEFGIGTTTPDAALHVYKAGDGQTPVHFETGNSSGDLYFYNDSDGFSVDSGGDLRFVTGRTGSGAPERVKITSAGQFGLGNITPSYFADLKVASNARLTVHNSGTGLPLIGFADGSSNYQDGRIDAYSLKIITGSGSLFGGSSGVNLANGATSWAAQSDERLKTNLAPIENGLTKVASLRAVTGRYLIDDPEKSRSFLIAQDVQAVLPEAVFADNDEDETLNLRYTEVIPLLVAALKESKDRIEALEIRVAQLEGGAA